MVAKQEAKALTQAELPQYDRVDYQCGVKSVIQAERSGGFVPICQNYDVKALRDPNSVVDDATCTGLQIFLLDGPAKLLVE